MTVVITIIEIVGIATLGSLTGYLAFLSILALFHRVRSIQTDLPTKRIAIIVPAHNECLNIGKTIKSLSSVDYPGNFFDIIVIADNCTDDTASIAESLGTIVLERTDTEKRGKGYALRWAFDRLCETQFQYDAFVVVDADSVVTQNFLRVMNAYLGAGADVIQSGDLVVRNDRSWNTEITRLGFTLYNHVRPLGRKVIGCPAGLRGNGMCFSRTLIQRIPWNAFGVTEDLQFGLTLLLLDVDVVFAPEAVVYATMPVTANNAVTQRARWEQGRQPVRSLYSSKLLRNALQKGSFKSLDAWIDLIIPPFVQLMTGIFVIVIAHWILAIYSSPIFFTFLRFWIIIFFLGIIHVVVGLIAARADSAQYFALLHVPRYVVWKIRLLLGRDNGPSPEEWIRTARDATPASGATEIDNNNNAHT